MELTQIDQNLPHSNLKTKNSLVIRVHMNHFQETDPLKKIYIKQKKTVKSKSKSKSSLKRRTSSTKLFANAHLTTENETFLNMQQTIKNLNHSKISVIKNSLKSSSKLNSRGDSKGKLVHWNSEQKQEMSKKIKNFSHDHPLKHIIQKVHTSVKLNQDPSKVEMGQISKIVFGEEGANWQDKSFEFVDESSIHGQQDYFYLEIGSL